MYSLATSELFRSKFILLQGYRGVNAGYCATFSIVTHVTYLDVILRSQKVQSD